jgi:hypothetical protein
VLGLCSQLLYVSFVTVWIFRWMRFYPGNPVEVAGTMIGLTLSVGACVTGELSHGLRRLAGIVVGGLTVVFWISAVLASVAV